MNSYITLALTTSILVAAPFAGPASAQDDAATEAEYCYVSGALYVAGDEVYPGGRYCVPIPG